MQKLLTLFFLFIFSTIPLLSVDGKKWRVVLVMQADDILYEPCYQALRAIAHTVTLEKASRVKVFVHVQQSGEVKRYRITTSGLEEGNFIDQSCPPYETLLATLHWALQDTAHDEHTMVIFSGHGTGILEPYWNEQSKRWVYEADKGSPLFSEYRVAKNEEFMHMVDRLLSNHARSHKGMFISSQNVPFLSMTSIRSLLGFASKKLGRKLDIVGFDACHMAMVEIATEIQQYAAYMIASQDCEEKEGWDYSRLLDICFSSEPHDVARSIVYAYEKKQKFLQKVLLSLAVFNLSALSSVNDCIDEVCAHLMKCIKHKGRSMQEVVCKARERNPHFCLMPMYADLSHFFSELLNGISLVPSDEETEGLRVSLLQAIESLNVMIEACATGSQCAGMGCSIYFPFGHIDNHYGATQFAKTAKWSEWLEVFLSSASFHSTKI